MKRVWIALTAIVLVVVIATGSVLGFRAARSKQPVMVCGEYALTNTELAYCYIN